jgi:hypothetical protein
MELWVGDLWHRLVCRVDGHDWEWQGAVDFDGNRLYVCRRCGVGQWRTAFGNTIGGPCGG